MEFQCDWQGDNMFEAKQKAMELAKDEGLLYVNGYDHPDIIAGQGTIGLEICEQVRDADAVVVPVGGGGLIAGVATAIKALSPKTKIIVCFWKIESILILRNFNAFQSIRRVLNRKNVQVLRKR